MNDEKVELTVDAAAELSDDELRERGLAPVRAYVRHTGGTKNAKRVRKHREKAAAAADGGTPRKQLNLTAPADDDARALLKEVSSLLLSDEMDPDEIRRRLRGRLVPPPAPRLSFFGRVAKLFGFR